MAIPMVAAAQVADTPTVHGRANASPGITLEPVILPEVGAEMTYIISQIAFMEMTEATGIFLIVPAEEFEENSILASRVRYTILEPDQVTQNPRIMVVAQPIDPETGMPLGQARWEAIYQLNVEEDEVEWESGSIIPEEYESFVKPYWMLDWSLTEFEDFPQGEIRPGATWSSMPEVDFGAEVFGMVEFPVTGEFVGWVQLPGVAEQSAHISERFLGESVEVQGQEIAEGLFVDVSYEMSGGNDLYLSPNAFPHQLEGYFAGSVHMDLSPEMQTLGVTGSLSLGIYIEISAQIDTLGAEWLEPSDSDELPAETIEIGQVLTGTLGPWSLDLDDGTYADLYVFWGNAGDEVRIRLESDEFDAYLFLLDDQDSLIAADDDSAGGTNAEIYHALTYTGLYYVVVNSYFAAEGGDYTLAVLSGVEPETDPVLIPGRPRYGRLDSATSFQFDDGTLADFYTFFGVEGQEVTVRLESSEFDAFLILFDDLDNVIEDDDSGGGTNALIRYTLPYTGDYYVIANAFFSDEQGEYTLVLDAVGDMEAKVAEAIHVLEQLQMGTASVADYDRAHDILTELARDIRLRLPLRVENVRLLAEPALDYGLYTERQDNRFRLGDIIHGYFEPKNFGVQFDGHLYRLELGADSYLIRDDGTIAWEHIDILHGVLESVHDRRDIFFYLDVALDMPMQEGEYTWRTVVKDLVSGETAIVEIPIEIYR